MLNQLNLKEIEKKAFRATYQDGLLDINMGGIVACMAYMQTLTDSEETPILGMVVFVAGMIASSLIFWLGKKYITLPRMGQATFGTKRRRRSRTLAVILGIIVALQAVVVIFSAVVWGNPELQSRLAFLEGEHRAMDLLVASIGAMFVGPSVALIAYFSDFLRGYYISLLMAVGVFLMIFLNQPVYLMVCAALIILPGIALFIRFVLTHPLPPAEARRG
ncbi:MAG: hypothetical protein JW987_06100 [Anaerolineaceae bacterium]|nr:hypothetical protein [Anaerolineaceae bacterium]